MGDQPYGISTDMLRYMAEEVKSAYDLGVEMAIVVGGGNIFRGMAAASQGMDRGHCRLHGNAGHGDEQYRLAGCLGKKNGIQTRVLSAISMHQMAEPYIRRRAVRHLEKQRIVIFAAGTGSPYFNYRHGLRASGRGNPRGRAAQGDQGRLASIIPIRKKIKTRSLSAK